MLDVIALAYTILVHAIEHYLTGATLLRLLHPIYCPSICCKRLVGITCVLVDEVIVADLSAVDTEHDALCPEARREL